ncbi:MAG TPA: glycosyltransferase family 2 protein [Bacillota bacterium]
MKVLIVIPAFNEAASVGGVVAGCRRALPEASVFVIDDGSQDATARVAAGAGAAVLRLPYNVGVGGAVQAGYRFALERGYEAVVRLDADGQHDPVDIHRLLEPLCRGEADYVVGSRFLEHEGDGTTPLRRLAIGILTGLLRLLTRTRFTDPTSGYRAAGPAAIRRFGTSYPADYPEVETLAIACREGLRVREVPVRMQPRRHGRSSITLARAIYYMLKVPLASLMRATAPRRQVPLGG